MTTNGYFRYPTVHKNRVVFVSEDDLWQVPLSGGAAIRLTSNLGAITRPVFSPDGTQIAFSGKAEGPQEVYVMPSNGGEETRLTFLGSLVTVVGWTPDGNNIVFASNAAQPFSRKQELWRVNCEGGQPTKLGYGLAHDIDYGRNGGRVLGRHTSDPARWKRYRGGTAGVLWIDPDGNGAFRPLVDIEGNLTSPLWIGARIYFISDHEGIGNLYSVNTEGEDLSRHTDHSDYYVRNASTDKQTIVYHNGGDIYALSPDDNESTQIPVEYRSPKTQRQRKFVSSAKYLEEYHIHPDGHSLSVVSRGKPYTFANWEGAVIQVGRSHGVRYQHTQWLSDGKRLVTISDESGEEVLEIHTPGTDDAPQKLDSLELGRPLRMVVSPVREQVVLANHRHELILVDLENQTRQVLDRSEYQRIHGIDWSVDGKWVAYSLAESEQTYSIKIADTDTGDCHLITSPQFRDVAPSFDPEGKYLYFLSYREFNPVYDSMYFDLNFPKGMRPFLVTLQKDVKSPFIQDPHAPGDEEYSDENTDNTSNKGDEDGEAQTIHIDFTGIENRVIQFPLPEGRYLQVKGIQGKVLFSSVPVKGSLDRNIYSNTPAADATLEYFDFGKLKKETVAKSISSFKTSMKSDTLVYRSKNKLRVLPVEPLSKHKGKSKPGRESGWIDLSRLKVSIEPRHEWLQMLREIWRLQREHFWVENMSGVDWEQIYKRYQPLVDRINSRSEFSDLVWEMQGELGTSHAYEIGGDYHDQPKYKQGFLGAEFAYEPTQDAYRITHIIQGDSWEESADSPLHRSGIRVEVGDVLVAVGGTRVSRETPPETLLVNQAESEVQLTLKKQDKQEDYVVTVKTLKDETGARYREWVEQNRQTVHKATENKVGYVHIPDMGPQGYAEFHRYYLAEVEFPALIVDVRYNGGGHVSQLILEKLARERIGYTVQRWGQPIPYPEESVGGPIVALTNELAGSDGDIFSHCFKLMNLGTLIGKRTWGGVIGIFPRHHLVDGSVTTQPEFSHWFADVGWGVENYGTDPDVEIDITPQEFRAGEDPQLDEAIRHVLEALTEEPVQLPDFKDKPDLTLPT